MGVSQMPRIDRRTRRLRPLGFLLPAMVLLIVLGQAASRPASRPATTAASGKGEPICLSPSTVDRLANAVSRDTFVAVVRFTTDMVKDSVWGRNGKWTKGPVPKTRWRWFPHTGDFKDLKFRGYFDVAGKFELVKTIRGKPPAMGRIDKKIEDLTHPDLLGRWWIMQPVAPLRPFTGAWARPQFRAWGPDERAQLFIVVGSPKAAGILDATFTGPIGKKETGYLKQFVEFLLSGDVPAKKDEAKWRELLKHKNPCVVMLGLQRLWDWNGGRWGTPRDYATAMRIVPPLYVKTVLFRGLAQARGNLNPRFAPDLIDQIKVLRKSAGPKRLESVDAAIRAYASEWTNNLAKRLRKAFPGVVATAKKPKKASSRLK